MKTQPMIIIDRRQRPRYGVFAEIENLTQQRPKGRTPSLRFVLWSEHQPHSVHTSLEKTYPLDWSDEFPYSPIEQLILNQLSYSLRSNKVCWQIRAVVDLRQISAGRFVLPCLAPFWLQ